MTDLRARAEQIAREILMRWLHPSVAELTNSIELALSEIRRETLEEAAQVAIDYAIWDSSKHANGAVAANSADEIKARIRALAQPKKEATDER